MPKIANRSVQKDCASARSLVRSAHSAEIFMALARISERVSRITEASVPILGASCPIENAGAKAVIR